MSTTQETKLHMKNSRILYSKIELLDFITEQRLEELQGICLEGSINMDARSNTRYTSNITLIIKEKDFVIGQNKRIWIDRKFRIYVGLEDVQTKEIIWFNKGIYILHNPQVEFSRGSVIISLEGLNKMSLLDETLGGGLQNISEILNDIPIHEAIKTTVSSLSGIHSYNIETSPFVTPYPIKKTSTDSVYSLLLELSELYMDWEFFFDINGIFIFRKMKNHINDEIMYDFYTNDKLTISQSTTSDYSNIKNIVQIWGKMYDVDDTEFPELAGKQISYEVKNTDINNPFNTTLLPETNRRIVTVDESNIFTYEQAKARGDYELMIHSNFNEGISIETVPIYNLDVGQICRVRNDAIGINGKYYISNISLGLSPSDTMTIQAYKVYN